MATGLPASLKSNFVLTKSDLQIYSIICCFAAPAQVSHAISYEHSKSGLFRNVSKLNVD